MSTLLRLYHSLPPVARSAVATARGAYLRWWRYGSQTERLMEEALERETWSPARWQRWQEERLARVLHRAATQVPYYRELWAARRRRRDRASWEALEHWPILEKETVQQNQRAFLADDVRPWQLLNERTSGTTGTPLDVWKSRRTLQQLYALSAVRMRGWHGVSLRDRWATLGGQLVVPVARRRPPFWVWNASFRQLYMSTYHLAPDLLSYYLDELARRGIVYIAGYASSLYTLAHHALHNGQTELRMKVVTARAEPLLPHQRATIGAAFACSVNATYGMDENVAAASTCTSGCMHLWPEVGLVECVSGERPVPPGAPGELICTGLLNVDMPLIRYRVGDHAVLADSREPCACGRAMPVISEIIGRTNDLLLTRDGRPVFWLNPIFYDLPVREGQIIQETLDRVRIRFAPGHRFGAAHGRELAERLRARMGDVDVVLEQVSHLARQGNGKLRAVICNLTPAERAHAVRRSMDQ